MSQLDLKKLDVFEKLIYELSSQGLTKPEIAKKLNVTTQQLIRLMKEQPNLEAAYENGLNESVREVEKALFKRATGYYVKEKKKRVTTGQFGETYERVEEMERYVPPDVNAIIFYLKNRAPDRWTDKHEIAMSMDKVEKFQIEFVSKKVDEQGNEDTKIIKLDPFETTLEAVESVLDPENVYPQEDLNDE